MLTDAQHLILFWVFVGFFLVIGVVALLAIVGIIKVDRQFLKWAIGGFVTGIAGVVFIWAKSQSPQLPLDIFVNLSPPEGVEAKAFQLVGGTYEYFGQSSSDKSVPPSGSVELTAGQGFGYWTAKIPYMGATKTVSVSMTLKDNQGNLWEVLPFYPNYNNQPLVPTQAPQKNAATFSPTLTLAKSAFAAEQEIRFNNYAKAIDTVGGRTYYKWRVFVDEPDQVLNRIAEVQYLLHPTFPQPLQVRTNPNDKFALEATGWGQFLIQITIKYKNRSTVRTSYNLDLKKGWP